MSDINFKEGWEQATLKCEVCKEEDTVEYDPARRKRHNQGELVQEVWSEAPAEYREKMIGLRSGMYICNSCFGS